MSLISKCLASVAFLGAALGSVQAQTMTGAGATFPAPMYAKWAEAYQAATGAQLNYQAIGSGGGVKQILAKTVDFGATDDPMSADDLEKHQLVQFPAVIGGIVAVFNLPGIQANQLVLNGPVLADLFRGAITQWNDPAIAKLNPGLKLPAMPVTLVYRSDSSGTTAVLTDYLAQVSLAFKAAPGSGKTVNWSTGIGGKGNAGVAANVSKLVGALGYVEYAFAKQNKLTYAALINRDGKEVHADDVTFAAAADKTDWRAVPGWGANLNHQHGVQSWPITSASFILMHRVAADPQRSAQVLKFFRWALNNGQKLALELDYVPLSAKLVKDLEGVWLGVKDSQGASVLR